MPRPLATEILFHPVRLRIVQTLHSTPGMTTTELHDRLPDIAVTTLYRHVRILARAGILAVVGERAARGAVERSFAIAAGVGTVSAEELSRMTREQHNAAFAAFLAGLLAEFERYTDRQGFDLPRDGVGYRQIPVWLDDAELAELNAAITDLVMQRAAAQDAEGRTRRLLTMIVLPG
jgi:DNA-binding transcriptional ArsR family regulator